MNQPDKMTLKGTLEQRQSDENAKKTRRSLAQMFAMPARWSLLLALILSPWAFGSVNYWAQQWIAVSLLVGLGFWWFETAMSSRKSQVLPYIAVLVLGGILIGMLQLVVLPDSVADWVLGRQKQIYDDLFGATVSGASISLDREGTWGQIRMLVLALSGLLLGARYFRSSRDCVLLLGICAANGVLISFVGILQKLTFNSRILWLFEFGLGTPFGPFINRNNAAGYLIMCFACCLGLIPIVMANRKSTGAKPMVSREMPIWRQLNFQMLYFISELTAIKLTVLLAAVIIASGVVSTLSRGGVLSLLIGGCGTIVIYGLARKPKNSSLILLPLIVMVVALTGWIGFGDQLMQRFEKIDMVDVAKSDTRVQHWIDTYPAIQDMGLLGSGLGSYRGVHRFYRSGRERALFEFAENQYFQSAVESGWPGFTLFLLAWLLAFGYALLLIYRGQSATSIGVGTFGIFLVIGEATASMFDFGLYIPANTLLMSVLIGFLGYHAHALAGRLRRKLWIRFEVPNLLVQVVLLVMFAGLTIVALDLYRRARFDAAMAPPPTAFNFVRMDLQDTDARIRFLEPRVRKSPTVESLNYLGELWVHRARIAFMNSLIEKDEYQNAILLMDEDEKFEMQKNVWNMTSLQRIQENYFYLLKDVSSLQAKRFKNSSFLTDNLPIAAGYFSYSLKRSPLQPTVHLRLGQIAGALGMDESGGKNVEHAISIAPNNSDYRMLVGIYYLQNGNVAAAAPHFRKYLELVPNQFTQLMKLFKGQTSRRVEMVNNREVLELVMPDNPRMLYQLATNWLQEDLDVREQALARADGLLGEGLPLRNPEILLRADIRLAQDNPGQAIDAMLAALKNNPMDEKTQYRVTKLLLEQGRLDEALDQGRRLIRLNKKKATYNDLVKQINAEIEIRKKLDNKEG